MTTQAQQRIMVTGAFLLFSLGSFPAGAAAASLFLSPASGAYYVGDSFSLLVKVDTAGVPINAASAQINFDNERLAVTSLGYSRSLFTIWTQEPVASNAAGTIQFSGGLPSPGFTGMNGDILRVTFQAKAVGSAPVSFVSGSVLANDGAGTNVAKELRGATYSFSLPLPLTPQVPPTAVPAPESGLITAERPLGAPVITEWARQINAGDPIIIGGIASPEFKVALFIQRGVNEPIRHEAIADDDGHFTFQFPEKAESGIYRVWVRSIKPDGMMSTPSDPVSIEVISTFFLRLSNIAFDYLAVIITLIALVVLLVLVLGWMWWRLRSWQARQGKEISEAERAVHKSFDDLKGVLGGYIGHLLGNAPSGILRRREKSLSGGLLKDLVNLEKRIEKEVEDIKDPKQ